MMHMILRAWMNFLQIVPQMRQYGHLYTAKWLVLCLMRRKNKISGSPYIRDTTNTTPTILMLRIVPPTNFLKKITVTFSHCGVTEDSRVDSNIAVPRAFPHQHLLCQLKYLPSYHCLAMARTFKTIRMRTLAGISQKFLHLQLMGLGLRKFLPKGVLVLERKLTWCLPQLPPRYLLPVINPRLLICLCAAILPKGIAAVGRGVISYTRQNHNQINSRCPQFPGP